MVQTKDSFLSTSLDNKNITYYDLRLEQSYTKVQQDGYFSSIHVNILLDDNIKITAREVYTITDVFSAIGGMFSAIVVFIRLLIINY